jgi:hypothetical protein
MRLMMHGNRTIKTENMKKIVILFLLCGIIFSCHKDKSSGNPILISKIYQDGLLEREYFYSADRKPVRRNLYDVSNGQSTLAGFRLYEYSTDGLMSAVTNFSASNTFQNKYSLQYDNNKQLTRMNDLNSMNALQFYYLFDYDVQGNLTSYTLYNANTNKKTTDAFYSYTPEGTISMIKRHSFIPAQVLHDSANYVFENKKFPSHWVYFEALPFVALPNGEGDLYYMSCKSSLYYYVDAPPLITTRTFSEKEFNSAGLPVKQRMDRKTDTGLGIKTSTELITYEYIN